MSATGSTIIRFLMFAVSSANVKSVNGVAKKNCLANKAVNDCKTKKQTENIGRVVCFFEGQNVNNAVLQTTDMKFY